MLINQSIKYVFAKGMPGIINLIALSVFTKIISPEQYGHYAIIISGVGITNIIFFQWLRVGLLRFYLNSEYTREVFLSTILTGFTVILLIICIIFTVVIQYITDKIILDLVIYGLFLLFIQAFYELNQELSRAKISPYRYGLVATIKAIISSSTGAILGYKGFGAEGLIIGLMLGMLLSCLIYIKEDWSGIKYKLFDVKLLKELISYGLPLTFTFIFSFVVSSSDRFILGWFLGAKEAGLYSVSYDLPKQIIVMLMMIVNLAAFPLALRALNTNGFESAKLQLKNNAIILFSIGIPSTAGLALLAHNISIIFLGKEFSDTAEILIPLISVGALLGGIKAYYFDLSFQLGKKTYYQIWVVIVAATVNLLLNLYLIPEFGIIGAAYSTIAAYIIGLYLSWTIGKTIFKLPIPIIEISKITAATLIMVILLWPIKNNIGIYYFIVQILYGVTIYSLFFIFMDVGGVKIYLKRHITRLRSIRKI